MTATITNKKSCSGSVEAGKTRLTTEWKPESQVPQYVKNELSKPHPNYILAFLKGKRGTFVQLKSSEPRTAYHLLPHDIKECESISDHMYRLSIITMLIKDSRVNRDRPLIWSFWIPLH
ncbi:BTE_collapsed_G0004370.mRNA.1.CDS.1 [Saccharomyces cerevisiae]|nr:BTE_collapsed_G0004370.mRNA.1.CDS.1 [Saccharomyces cerevisiae]